MVASTGKKSKAKGRRTRRCRREEQNGAQRSWGKPRVRAGEEMGRKWTRVRGFKREGNMENGET